MRIDSEEGKSTGFTPDLPDGRTLVGARAPALEWARSGAMHVSGRADGPPVLAPGAIACRAGAALSSLWERAGRPQNLAIDGAALLGERAAIAGSRRAGRCSPGGSCRLLRAGDDWIAVNLARPDDRALLAAWLGPGERGADTGDPWRFVEERVSRRPAAELLERGRLLGLPVAPLAPVPREAPPWCRVARRGETVPRAPGERPVVVDLSSLWAGPLCTHLLERAGARVIRVESTGRPDAARWGPPAFFDLLNAGKESVALDFADAAGRRALERLVAGADIVVESARPRALAQLGIEAERLVEDVPGLTWVAISGYGRREPGAGWVAFGDDAGVAAGLHAQEPSGPLFCGDAVADPLTGIHAALAAWASWSAGGGALLDLCLRDVVASCLVPEAPGPPARVVEIAGHFWVEADGERECVRPPRARAPRARARPFGADSDRVLAERAAGC